MTAVIRGCVRYVRLYAHFIAFSFGRAFEFRFDFYMRIIMDLFYYAVQIAFFRILYLHTPGLGGWNESQAMIFVSGYLIVDAINMTLFTNNMWALPTLINRGDLDYYLVRPVSSLFFVSVRDFAVNSFLNLVFAVGIFIWAISRYEGSFSFGQILLFMVLILNGAIIFYCMNILANLITFWSHSSQSMGEMVWSLLKFAERPDRIFTGWTRRILTTILPFCLIASFPARILLEGFRWPVLFQLTGVTVVFLGVVGFVWDRGLKSYSSASS